MITHPLRSSGRSSLKTYGGPRPRPRISVVIPALNEAKNLPHVFEDLPSDLHEVILVDGRSTDGTLETARALCPGIRTVSQPGRGKGDALAAGYAAVTGDIVVTLDSDGSADAKEIPAFVGTLLAGADFAKGSRFLDGGGSADITRFRAMGNRCLTLLVNLLYRTRYTDLCYGYNAFWARHIPLIAVGYDGFEFEMLVNCRIAKVGLRVVEVPSFELPRIHGESNLNAIRDGIAVLKAILKEHRRKLPREMTHRGPILESSFSMESPEKQEISA